MLLRALQVTVFKVHLKYDERAHPRRGDVVVMEYEMSMDLDKEDLLFMSRVKGKLGVIFLSDMMTADGKNLETSAYDPGELEVPQSKFNFLREVPTDHDWEMWKSFWRQHTVEKFQLHTPLGAWTSCTHRRWIWYYDEGSNSLKKKKGPDTEFYFPAGHARTRSNLQYVKVGTGQEEPTYVVENRRPCKC